MKIALYLSAVLLLCAFPANAARSAYHRERGVDPSSGSPAGARIFEGRKQRGATAGSTVAVSPDGAVFEREPAGRGRGVFLGAAEGIRTSLTDAQKALYLSAIGLLRAQHASSVSLLHRIGYVKDTIAILEQARQLSGGTGLRCELDRGNRPYGASRIFRSEEGAAGRAGMVRGECRQSAPCGLAAGSLLPPGKAGSRKRRTSQGARLSAAERLQGL